MQARHGIPLAAVLFVGAGCKNAAEGNQQDQMIDPSTPTGETDTPGPAPGNPGAGPEGNVGLTPTPGSLIITELMPSAEAAPIAWIEVHNPTSEPVNLEGCVFSDGADESFVITGATTIAAGSFAVLASAADAATDAPDALRRPAYVFDGGAFDLANDASDRVVLTCAGALVDETGYDEYKPAMARGARAIQLNPDALDAAANDDVGNWCNVPLDIDALKYDMHNHASAGAANPKCDTFPYFYYEQEDVLLDGVDFGATVDVAIRAAAKGGTTSLMVLWAMRDQEIDARNAARVATLYLESIGAIYDATGAMFDWNFGVWHSAWAISNLYRNGDADVKAVLQAAYDDAIARPATLEQFRDIAELHVLGAKTVMGDVHDLGRSLARRTIVVPGNPDYLQSADEYK